MATKPNLAEKLPRVDEWVRQEFAKFAGLAEQYDFKSKEESGPGIAFRRDSGSILRLHPKTRWLCVGFPDSMREEVDALTGALRKQSDTAWVNYGPGTFDRSTLELLLEMTVGIESSRGEYEGSIPCLSAQVSTNHPSRHPRNEDADLTLILNLLRAFVPYERDTGKDSNLKVLREAIYFHWEGPRLPPGRTRAPSLKHSMAARQRRNAGKTVGLIYEHAVPVSLVLREMLNDLPADTTILRARLEASSDRVIITSEEDERLTAAGLRGRMPDRDDVRSRYRAAGIDPEQFLPWTQDVSS